MRLIDAEWLLNFFEPYPNDYQTPLGLLRACVDDAPSIKIIRCRECRHRPIKEDADGENYGFNLIEPNDGDDRCPCLVSDGWYSWMPEDDFYCGYGERDSEKPNNSERSE